MVSEEGIEKALEDIEALKEGLAELTTDHAAVVKQLRKELLDLQQLIAALKINTDVGVFCDIMDTQLCSNANYATMRTQIVTDAAVAKSRILTSNSPFALLSDFRDKWKKKLLDSGANVIDF